MLAIESKKLAERSFLSFQDLRPPPVGISQRRDVCYHEGKCVPRYGYASSCSFCFSAGAWVAAATRKTSWSRRTRRHPRRSLRSIPAKSLVTSGIVKSFPLSRLRYARCARRSTARSGDWTICLKSSATNRTEGSSRAGAVRGSSRWTTFPHRPRWIAMTREPFAPRSSISSRRTRPREGYAPARGRFRRNSTSIDA